MVKMMNGSQVSWESNENRTEQVCEIALQKSSQDKLYRVHAGGGEGRGTFFFFAGASNKTLIRIGSYL